MQASDTAISMRGLTKTYPGVQALIDLTLDVPTGSVFGFLGPNGAGKTTAIRVLAGLTRPTSGVATVAGRSVTDGDGYRTAIGYLGQEPHFYGWMSGADVLRYVAGFYPWVADPLEARIRDILHQVGLTDAADRPTRTYSGGMRQRLGIAQAMVGRPRVLILDEPASALDPIGRHDVLDLMGRLRSEATIFYSTHILADVQRVSDHVAILDRGRLVQTAPTAELLASFNRDKLRVIVRGDTSGLRAALTGLPEVASATPLPTDDGTSALLVATRPGGLDRVQREVTRLAQDLDLTLIANAPDTLDLEDVFLRLIDQTERAA
jgi:ABC-2 type transport system ATP-binding protein